MSEILELFNAGGNAALVVIAVAIWRVETRLVKLETKFDMHMMEGR